jgi:TolA-binding protein
MTRHQCDRLWEVDALREGRLGPKDADAAKRHADTCSVCGAARARSEELDSWLAGASLREPTALELRRTRVRVLRSVGVDQPVTKPRIAVRVAFASAAVCLIGLGIFFGHRRFAVKTASVAIAQPAPSSAPQKAAEENSDFAATVRASVGARWTQARDGSIEHVELDEGKLSIHVRHRNEGEQVVVDLPDGTLEDRGTTFEIEAHGGHTTRITVIDGAVAFRIRGAAEIVLGAGSTWPEPPAARPSHASTTTALASAAPQPDDDGSASYAAAVSLLRHRSFAAAASGFHDYVQAHPHEPDAEDASYLEAVALAQAGDTTGAIAAAERHLASYPRSFHRKEASLLIARLSRDAGDCEKARKVLAPWLGANADAEAQATLRSCAGP